MRTTLSKNGQLVLPAEICNQLGLSEEVSISCEIVDGKVVLTPGSSKEKASLIEKNGRPVLVAPAEAPELTPEFVKEILSV